MPWKLPRYLLFVAMVVAWPLAIVQFGCDDVDRPARTRPQQGAILCRCESRCDCGLTHNECPCEEIAKTLGE